MIDNKDSPRKESVFKKDWTKGPIISNLLLLSWPMIIMEALYMGGQIVDMIWVGRLGAASIAGVGIANMVVMVVMAMDFGLIIGARAMIARYMGAHDFQGANRAAGQAIILASTWGILITVMGILLAEPILGLFGVEDEVITEGAAYMRVIFAGWIALEVLVNGLYAVQSSGDTIKPMVIEGLIRAVHVTLCPFLVLGWWLFPSLGVSGAALSNIISHSLGAVIVLALLFSGRTRLRLALRDFRPVPSILKRILRIGVPALIMHAQRFLGELVLMWIISPFGTLAVAAHSLVLRVELFLFAFGIGLGGGTGVLVGQNLGAGQPKRAERSGWQAIGLLESLTVVFSLAILFRAEYIIGIFTTEPGLVELGSLFLRIAAAGYVMIGFVFVLQDGISGAGDTLPPMIVSIAMIWLVQLPLAFLLPQFANIGVYGVRWAIVASTAAGAIAYVTYFVLGRWKAKKV